MNCEECKEQVLELIERASSDEAAVREILDRCPDCRALFDDMKSALAALDQLPLEDPPAHLDAEILRAAAARRRPVTRLRSSRVSAPPWAMAAIALLAVGVGVWAIPGQEGSEESASDGASVEREQAVAAPAAEPLDQEEAFAAGEPAVARAPRVAEERAAQPVADRGDAKRAPKPARKRAPAAATLGRNAKSSAAPAKVVAQDAVAESAVAGALAADTAAMDDAPAAATASARRELPEDEAKSEAEPSASCKKAFVKQRERDARDSDAKVDPEDQLELGRCYAELGDIERARTWLSRAASHRETGRRAKAALDALPSE